ncbi:52 kDa repressor of the inhibitor of the protein kinase [Drosophila ficusphila]|uniref:52 kDa repressor of the inhibitor of the protein kinase n=1 Tax=Drosophila ficusphila TaxID=30025 RepID=UPI0007E72D94|nr:52 kDa repressor of the inhibitor of the protein kinase [Drosophila ficusphila]
MRCAVNNCGNNNRNCNRIKWRYFHFPKEKPVLQKWIDFCQRKSMNPATACICNEHFTPEDFERNMQYELGFTRKNPTKLKPGSFPTINKPRMLKKRGKPKKDNFNVSSAKSKKTQSLDDDDNETIEIQLCDFATDLQHLRENSSSNEDVELISESDLNKDPKRLKDYMHLEVEILDPLNPQPNAKDHVEIVDSEGDNYVKHLEHEVCSLKREVFFLKEERKKLLEELRILKATFQKTEV